MVPQTLDPTFDDAAWTPARARRIALAAYLDYVIWSIPLGLIDWTVRTAAPGFTTPLWARVVTFTIVELALLRLAGWSPGTRLLSITFAPARVHTAGLNRIWHGHLPYVSRRIKDHESWFTLALATWILLDASKSFLRWTMWDPPLPLFGYAAGEGLGALTAIATGAVETTVAAYLFRMSLRAVQIGLPYWGLSLASAIVSWDLWETWAAEMTVRRRAFQGVPIRAGEIELAQATAAWIVAGSFALAMLLLLRAVPRLRRAGRPAAAAEPLRAG